jgi:hypothetical protein
MYRSIQRRESKREHPNLAGTISRRTSWESLGREGASSRCRASTTSVTQIRKGRVTCTTAREIIGATLVTGEPRRLKELQ